MPWPNSMGSPSQSTISPLSSNQTVKLPKYLEIKNSSLLFNYDKYQELKINVDTKGSDECRSLVIDKEEN